VVLDAMSAVDERGARPRYEEPTLTVVAVS
jgi:hypothetical protein